ncbi:MAG: hypothetical protein EXX96DRAFT_580023 [Benjaminiella poitrasii]|nr:MAG: hypothetical protein EXX96DRAFT_580023 [Benjaminiella poitrasii]
MKADYCVDYLSYQWSSEDLIQTYKENYKQRRRYVVNTIATDTLLTKNERRLKKSEDYKLLRFQNALWRTMARNCTKQLGQSNQLVDPSTVSWQKESDITWLYGPIYTAASNNRSNEMEKNSNRVQPTPTLKPVLKKYNSSNVTQTLPTYSETTTSSTTVTSRSNSFSSISSKSSSVHFNPEIIEIEYQPEYPVSSYIDYDDDDIVWTSLVQQAGISLKSFIRQGKQPSSLRFVTLLASMMKSVVSLSTTWILYQCLSWLTKQKALTSKSCNHTTTAAAVAAGQQSSIKRAKATQ